MPARSLRYGTILLTLLFSIPVGCASSGAPDGRNPSPGRSGLQVARLRCESQANPLGVDTAKPRLSWILTDPGARGQRQTAYHLLVATDPSRLRPGKADLWDSGRVESDQSILIEYAGQPLATNRRVFWTVRAWDRDGQPTGWAEPAEWTTGVMSPDDWHAQWIGQPPPAGPLPQEAITRAKWIWFPEQGPGSEGTTSAPADAPESRPIDAPPGERHFRKAFALPAGKSIASALVVATADNESWVVVNGKPVGRTDEWAMTWAFDVATLLKPGEENVIAVRARNGGGGPNPAGVIATVVIAFADGSKLEVPSDESWQSARKPDGPWEPARRQAAWGGRPWQSAGYGEFEPLPIFRKSFALAKPVKRAVVNVSGLGHYTLLVNGRRAHDTVLNPPWSKYERTAYYDTLDVTPLLEPGDNAFGVVLAKGFYTTRGDRRVNQNRADRPLAVRVQAMVEFEDGSTETISSDPSWKWTPGPYAHNSILGGPSYDARGLPDGWARPGFDDARWRSASAIEPGVGELRHSESPPLRTYEAFSPKSIDEPEPGHFVYDFGQNASATVRLKVKGPAGATLRMTYAEQRHGAAPHRNDGKGLVNQSGIRAPNFIEYTCRGGGEETWFCDLFYSGFQYVELTGAVPAGRPNPQDKPVVTELTSVHVRSGAETIGTFEPSNPDYAKIDRLVDWSVRSNLSHVLTDCPHREKMGWLEVPHLMWSSIAGRYDLSRFGPKVCRDIRESQLPDGQIPTVAPSYPVFDGAFQYTPEWGAAGVLIPWYVYEWYGDRRTLEESYDSMRAFVDYMRSTADADLVPKAGLGDWYDYGHGQPMGPSRYTPVELSATATFYDCAIVVADAAGVLGKIDDRKAYRQLARDVAAGFDRRFYAGDGVYRNTGSCQTANAMALVTGLVDAIDPRRKPKVVRAIVDDLEKRDWQQTAGDVGFHYLVRALADNGQSDALYRVCDRKEMGSYQFIADAGWTSLPESWDANGSYSMNHCMLGHIQEWFWQDLIGIAPHRDAIAFKTFEIRPTPSESMKSAAGSYESPYGTIRSAWKVVEDGRAIELEVTVPVNTTALVRLPGGVVGTVTESGKPLAEADGVEVQQVTGKLRVGSGTYRFRAPMPPRHP